MPIHIIQDLLKLFRETLLTNESLSDIMGTGGTGIGMGMGSTIMKSLLDSKIKQLYQAISQSSVDQLAIASEMKMSNTLLNMKLKGNRPMSEDEYELCLRTFQRLSVEAMTKEAQALAFAGQASPTSAPTNGAEDNQTNET